MMRLYHLRYSETSSKQIKSLHPGLKPLIKKHIEELKETPLLGKPLERELSGYYSLRTKKFRIIYNVDHKKTYYPNSLCRPEKRYLRTFQAMVVYRKKEEINYLNVSFSICF